MTDRPGGAPAFEQPDFSQFADGEAAPELDDDEEYDEADETDDVDDVDDADEGDDADEANQAIQASGRVSYASEAGDPDGNTVVGGRAASVLEHVATTIVDEKDAVVVETRQNRGQLRLSLHVAPSDMGRIIGRRGRTAQAVRTLVRAAAAADGQDVFVDIVD
jgi:predicted RNA-binding protein YlqC (UPF0109 family)